MSIKSVGLMFAAMLAPVYAADPDLGAHGGVTQSGTSTVVETMTGCLSRGETQGTFVLKKARDEQNHEYDVVQLDKPAADLKLADHVGHRVELKGQSVGKPEKSTIAAESRAKEKAAQRHFTVVSMKHLAAGC